MQSRSTYSVPRQAASSNNIQVILPDTTEGITTPLILIHDAGGTLLSYYALGAIDRPVYGISDPHFESEAMWKKGIEEMAQAYYRMVKSKVANGSILLGGWSLGGVVAFQLAWIFARDPDVHVKGIVMIDSPFPHHVHEDHPIDAPPLPKGTSLMVRKRMTAAMRRSLQMLDCWTAPQWHDDGPPPVIMLRASDALPVAGEGSGAARVDQFREDSTLGWQAIRPPLVMDSWNLPGHHFSVFASENIDYLTTQLNQACQRLDKSG